MTKSEQAQQILLKLTHAVEASDIGSWEWDVKRNIITWTPNVFRIYGLNEYEFDGTFESYRKLIHPDDLEMIDLTIRDAIMLKKNYTFQHRFFFPDKSVGWLEAMGSVVVDEFD